jgi:cytochrome c oxidase subunit 2
MRGVARHPLVAAVVVGIVLVVAGCADVGLPDPVTEQGEQTRDLWRIFIVIAAAIGALVYGLVIYVVIRYRRRRPGAEPPPSQRQVVVSLEVLYTAVPLAIVGVLLGLSIRTERDVTAVVDDPDVRVQVIGFQWEWQFNYLDDDVTVTGLPDEPPEIVLPVGATVRFELESADVVHSFWVPKFLTKLDLIPGVENSFDVQITEAGTWTGVCSEFCGLEHWRMAFSVRAVPEAEFTAWIEERARI